MDKFFLHINEPCQQDWNSMTANEKGRFCESCQKIVIDFTTSTDTELTHFFRQPVNQEVCGRFYEHQLDTWFEDSEMKRINPKLYKYLLSLMLLAAAQNSSAQQAEVIRTETELPAIATKSLKLAVADEKETDSSVIKANASNQKVQIRLGGARATTLSSDNKPLYVVDGKFVNSDRFKNFNPNSIKSIDILKASTAVALYGPSGVNGVIIIVTKKCEDSKKETVPTS